MLSTVRSLKKWIFIFLLGDPLSFGKPRLFPWSWLHHSGNLCLHNQRGHQTANMRSGDSRGERAFGIASCLSEPAGNAIVLPNWSEDMAWAASTASFWAGFKRYHSCLNLGCFEVVLNSTLTNTDIKFKKNFKELRTLEVNLYQTDGVILLLELLCSCRSPEAEFDELAEQSSSLLQKRI